MKIWNGYGSEHSTNLVMIGKFKDTKTAASVYDTLNSMMSEAEKNIADPSQRWPEFSPEMLKILNDAGVIAFSKTDLEELTYEHSLSLEGDRIILETEEYSVGLFLKMLALSGARVETYSAHDHPNTGYGR